jgi:glycosyl transferase family 25
MAMPEEALEFRADAAFRTLYINRDKDAGRRQLIEQRLAGVGLQAHRLPAVDGYDLPPGLAPYFAHVVMGKPPLMTAGEVGCYASHLKAHKQILAGQSAASLILEDDAVLDERLPEIVRETLAALPPGWDVVHLSHTHRRHAVKPLAQLPCGRTLVRFSRIPSNTAGYLISPRGAAKLLNDKVLRFWPIDTDVRRAWVFDLDVYGLSEPLVRQDETLQSLIGRSGGHRRSAKRRGLPHPTAYSWTNTPLRTPQSLVFNVRKLGIGWWLRCLLANSARKVRLSSIPLGGLAAAAMSRFKRA